MAKPVTLKDVLYALEFTGASLCHDAGKWAIGGLRVPARIAEEARRQPNVHRTDVRFGGYEEFRWAA